MAISNLFFSCSWTQRPTRSATGSQLTGAPRGARPPLMPLVTARAYCNSFVINAKPISNSTTMESASPLRALTRRTKRNRKIQNLINISFVHHLMTSSLMLFRVVFVHNKKKSPIPLLKNLPPIDKTPYIVQYQPTFFRLYPHAELREAGAPAGHYVV